MGNTNEKEKNNSKENGVIKYEKPIKTMKKEVEKIEKPNTKMIKEVEKIELVFKSKFTKSEEDKIKGLDLDSYEDFIESIFTKEFDESFKNDIMTILKEYKHSPIGNTNQFSKLFFAKTSENNNFFSLIFGFRKTAKDKIDICYKLIQTKLEIGYDISINYQEVKSGENPQNDDIKIDKEKVKNKEILNKISQFIKGLINNFNSLND